MAFNLPGGRLRAGVFFHKYGVAVLVVAACLWGPETGLAQSQSPASKGNADRAKALELSYEHRDLEALPLLEALTKADPKDREVQERLAVSLITKSATVSADEGKALRKRTREILLALKKTGKISDLSEILAEGIPEDGGVQSFATQSRAGAAMKEGEAAFARRDFEAARRAYQRALMLDPKLYAAALFVGDTYFAEGREAQARPWFSRAILIAPDQETAHRYLGDAQAKSGLPASALTSYLDAVLAEPYNRRPRVALGAWAKANNVTLGHPRIVPEELENAEGGKPLTKASVDGKPDDGRSQWHRYAETRAAWSKSRFKAAFPGQKEYRHSLAEEVDALRQVARAVDADVKAGKVKTPNPSFATLIALDKEDLLEAYVLYARPDQGIAQDYNAYRKAHRGELRRYLHEYFAHDTNSKAKEDNRP